MFDAACDVEHCIIDAIYSPNGGTSGAKVVVYLAITVKYLRRRCAASCLIGANRCARGKSFFPPSIFPPPRTPHSESNIADRFSERDYSQRDYCCTLHEHLLRNRRMQNESTRKIPLFFRNL